MRLLDFSANAFLMALVVAPFTGSFVPISTSSYQRHHRASWSKIEYSQNPFDGESSGQKAQRMKLVRDIQRTFYSDESGVYPPQHGVYSNMPLFRGDWTELPGFQHVINVTDPDYTNMLMKVIVGKNRPWYYGHIFLPGGTANIDDYRYRLEKGSEAPIVGTLMQVSDYKQLEDGGLNVVVQALGRFLVVDTIRSGSPYGIGTVEMLPDLELVEHYKNEAEETAASFDFALNDDTRGAACAGAIAEAGTWHSYEFQAVEANGNATSFLPPVASFNKQAAAFNSDTGDIVHTAIEEYLSQSPSNMFHGECSIEYDSDYVVTEKDALRMEYELWIELDELANVLSKLNPKANTEMPIPTQLIGLLPRGEDEDRPPWPKSFKLGRYVKKMSNVYSILSLSGNAAVKVDDAQNDQLNTVKDYPALRRARRLSYMVWALLDTVLGDEYIKDGKITKQEILEINSTTGRLQAAIKRIQEINATLREVLGSTGQ